MDKAVFLSDEYIKELYNIAMNCFNGGIYVYYSNHPCGWDFIDFNYVEDDNKGILAHKFWSHEISDGIYQYNIFEGKTLKEILKRVGEGNFSLEMPITNFK